MATPGSHAPVPVLGDMNGRYLRLAWEHLEEKSLDSESQSPNLSDGLRLHSTTTAALGLPQRALGAAGSYMAHLAPDGAATEGFR